jgi:hypothetical protein
VQLKPDPLGSTRIILCLSSLSASPLRYGHVRSSVPPVGRIVPFPILFALSFSKGSQAADACAAKGLGLPGPAARGRGVRRFSLGIAYFQVGSLFQPLLRLRASGRAAGGSFVGARLCGR